jgi:uncharacterized integral membrane protein (TIGR00698 family)
MNIKSFGFWIGLAMTAVLALLGKALATLPFLSIIGQMVLAILLGMLWTTLTGTKRQLAQPFRTNIASGQTFASKMLLRAGIILLGVRLDLVALGHAGIRLLATEIVMVTLTVLIGYWIARKLKVEPALAIVVACGTAICGAAAAVAIAVQVRAKSEHTVLGVAIVAVLGTLFTIADTLLYPLLGLSPHTFGVFTGATLHEIAHVIAAATPFGSDALDTAILVKLSRVVLLAPVAMIVGAWFARREQAQAAGSARAEIAATAQSSSGNEAAPQPKRTLPIPWFVLGFIVVGVLHTWHLMPAAWTPFFIQTSLFLLTMGMAGLGLQVNMKALRGGRNVFVSAVITSILLATAGWFVAKTFLL